MTDRLVKSYRKYDTESTLEQDAKEAFARMIPFIQERYPFIHFDQTEHPSKDGKGNYHVFGSYEGKFLWVFPEDKFIELMWGKSAYPQNENYDEFLPIVRLDFCYEINTLEDLEELLEKNIKR
jgi:hypothetical protein